MDRPTRRHRSLRRKLEEVASRSRKSGAKQRRMRRWVADYEHLIAGADKSRAPDRRANKPAASDAEG
jgi:hypothetical protein